VDDEMKVFLTGGTGFLGGRLALALAQAGNEVLALTRSGKLPADLLQHGVKPVTGDLTATGSFGKELSCCDMLFHTAAFVKTWTRDQTVFDKVNVTGTLELLKLAQDAGVGKIIYTSSFMALGPTDGIVANETLTHPVRHTHNAYERTKHEALGMVRHLRDEGKSNILVTFPGVVYGPGALTDGNLVVSIMHKYLARKLPGLLGDGNNRWCYSFVDDVVKGHILVAEKAAPGSEYILGGENASQNDFVKLMHELSGVKPPKLHLPYWAAKMAGGWELLLANLFGRQPENPPNVIEIYKHEWAYSSQKAENEVGYTTTSLREGFVKTLEWMKKDGIWKPTG
jgi:NAD+-dependent farnesol dehydrogenase